MPSSLHQKHLLSVIPPQFLVSGTGTDFSKPGLVTNHKALQLRYILEYDLQESSWKRMALTLVIRYCTFCTSPLFLHMFLSCKKYQPNHFKGSKLNIRGLSGQYQAMQNIQQLYTQLLQ